MNDEVRQPTGHMDLVVPDESLSDFKRYLDELMEGMRESSADAGKVADTVIDRQDFGHGFTAAVTLYARYNDTVGRLTVLAQMFDEAVEALGIVTMISERGYQEVDAEHHARLKEIRQGLEQHYDPDTGLNSREVVGVTATAH